METLLQDIRYGLRILRKYPAFTAAAVSILALGIGANTAIFSLLNSLFLQRLPVQDPSQLVHIYQNHNHGGGDRALSYPDFVYYRKHNRTLSDVAAQYPWAPISLTAAGESNEINGAVVSSNYFSLLGLRPFLGRFFLSEEDDAPDPNPVAVISFALWQRRFGSDPQILGNPVRLNGVPFTIAGVAPKDFHGANLGELSTEVWIPSAMFHVGYRYCDAFQRDCPVVDLIGRLKVGQTVESAQTELSVLARQLEASFPETNEGLGVLVKAARGTNPGSEDKRTATLLAAAVAIVLLIACANVAGLVLARNCSRRREIAARLALGAGRWRLTRQLLTESLILSLMGGALGLIVAHWANILIYTFYSVNAEGQRAYFPLGLDPIVLAFTLGFSILSGVTFGLVPALQAGRADLVLALKGADIPGIMPKPRLRDALVVTQVALSIVLVVSAGLLLRSLQNIYHGPGFDPTHVVLLRLRPQLIGYNPSKAWGFQREVIRRLNALPGVVSASVASYVPVNKWGGEEPIWLPSQVPQRSEIALHVGKEIIGPRYFETLAIPFVRGRDFNGQDRKDSPPVAIINESLAHHFWPTQDSTGGVLVVGGKQYQVIGVVKDAQYRTATEQPHPFVYLNYWQNENWDSRTHVRVSGDPHTMLRSIRREVAAVDPNVPISEDRPLTEWIDYSFQPVRIASKLLTCFSLLAVLLSAMGLYGVLAFVVAQRTREIGIRIALGAERTNVAGLVLGRGVLLAVTGICIGIVGAFVLSYFLNSLLYDVRQQDPLTFVVGPAVLLCVAVLACYFPMRRATQVDPSVALRYE